MTRNRNHAINYQVQLDRARAKPIYAGDPAWEAQIRIGWDHQLIMETARDETPNQINRKDRRDRKEVYSDASFEVDEIDGGSAFSATSAFRISMGLGFAATQPLSEHSLRKGC